MVVTNVIPGTTASNFGICEGWSIYKIDGKTCTDKDEYEGMEIEGDEVDITFQVTTSKLSTYRYL